MTPWSLADDTGVSSWPRKGTETSDIFERNLEETAQRRLLFVFFYYYYLIYFQSSATYCIISAHYFEAFWRGVVCYILNSVFETQHLRFMLTYYLQNKDRVKMFSLRKHPFLLALRPLGTFRAKRPQRRRARRNGCFRRLENAQFKSTLCIS